MKLSHIQKKVYLEAQRGTRALKECGLLDAEEAKHFKIAYGADLYEDAVLSETVDEDTGYLPFKLLMKKGIRKGIITEKLPYF